MPVATRLQDKGQVTIPLEIREELNLKKGDLVTFVRTKEGYVIRPGEVVDTSALDEIGRLLKEKGVSFEQLMASSGAVRAEIAKERFGLTTRRRSRAKKKK